MSLKAEPIGPIPQETARLAKAVFAEGSPFMKMRDELGTLFQDELFATLFPKDGQPALAPWRLALVTIMQFAEKLSDRQAAHAVRKQRGLIKAGGRQRTDATHVLAAVRAINGVVCVGAHDASHTQCLSGRCPGVVTLRGLRTNGMSGMNAALRNSGFAIRTRKTHSAGRNDRS